MRLFKKAWNNQSKITYLNNITYICYSKMQLQFYKIKYNMFIVYILYIIIFIILFYVKREMILFMIMVIKI